MKLKVVSRGVVSVSLPLPNPGPDDASPPPPVNYNNNINTHQQNQELIKKEVPDEEQGLVLALFTPDLTKSNPSTSTTPPSQVGFFNMLICLCVYMCVCLLLYCL